MVDPLSAVQAALSAVLLTVQERDEDARALMFSIADEDRWPAVSALMGVAGALAVQYCKDHDTDPVEYLQSAVFCADPSVEGGGLGGE